MLCNAFGLILAVGHAIVCPTPTAPLTHCWGHGHGHMTVTGHGDCVWVPPVHGLPCPMTGHAPPTKTILLGMQSRPSWLPVPLVTEATHLGRRSHPLEVHDSDRYTLLPPHKTVSGWYCLAQETLRWASEVEYNTPYFCPATQKFSSRCEQGQEGLFCANHGCGHTVLGRCHLWWMRQRSGAHSSPPWCCSPSKVSA